MYRNWRSLIRPRGVEVQQGEDPRTYAKIVARPLERGFGITLGNALRRVLLSSLQGGAITAIKVEGVLHEFSTIDGVVEDVTDVILNLKGVLLKMEGHEPSTLILEKEGEGPVTAGDISETHDVTVLNKDHKICTLARDGKLRMELTIKKGKGYVPAEQNADPEAPIDTIPIDAIFSPVRKVNYTVGNARVGQRTDYDKLTMQVWTDGSVAPVDAVAFAAKILKEQLQVFINFTEEEEPAAEGTEEEQPQFNENLYKTVDELELSVRSANCLQNANIKYIYELVEKTEAEMLKTKNFGRKSLNEIREILGDMGLSLGMKLHNFPRKREEEE
jgi:DNA-directed RNA polymerase subunit alpha